MKDLCERSRAALQQRGKFRIHRMKNILGVFGHIGTELQKGASRHNMVSGHLVAHLDLRNSGERIAGGVLRGNFPMLGRG